MSSGSKKWVLENAQRLLEEVGYYKGPIDGVVSAALDAAALVVARNMGLTWSQWGAERRIIAAAQRILNVQGFGAGLVDGIAGSRTIEAMKDWCGECGDIGAPDGVCAVEPIKAMDWPTQANVAKVFGPAGGPRCTAGTVRFPFAHVLAWDLKTTVPTFKCHEMIAPAFQRVFDKAAKHYGEGHYRHLKLDRFGGCYNNRAMRGSKAKSMHAWGIAVDLDPENNQLRWGRDRAAFARPEYVPFWKIVEDEGLVSLGRVRNFDWMHFQGARV